MTVWFCSQTPSGIEITINCDHVAVIEPTQKYGAKTLLTMFNGGEMYITKPYKDVIAGIRRVEKQKTR